MADPGGACGISREAGPGGACGAASGRVPGEAGASGPAVADLADPPSSAEAGESGGPAVRTTGAGADTEERATVTEAVARAGAAEPPPLSAGRLVAAPDTRSPADRPDGDRRVEPSGPAAGGDDRDGGEASPVDGRVADAAVAGPAPFTPAAVNDSDPADSGTSAPVTHDGPAPAGADSGTSAPVTRDGPDPVRTRQPERAARAGQADPDGRFFGRVRELRSLHGDLERAGLNTISGRKEPRARVLLVAGRPGSGRSALAAETARQLAGSYPDGVVRTRLTEPGGEPVPTERTAREILEVFGVATPPGAGADELSGMVREALAERRVLLLLDDAEDAEQVDPFVPDNPECLVVAVGQGPLTGIPDVRPCTLGGMDAKAAIELLARFAGAVRITVDPQAAESLAEECGGQPAALVLAGGWLAARPTASVADLAKQMRAVLDDPDRPAGDRPVARAFQLVYGALPQPAARLLRLLALAPAGLVDAQTASALAGCSVPAAAATLRGLVGLGLLRPADAPTTAARTTGDGTSSGRASGAPPADDRVLGDRVLDGLPGGDPPAGDPAVSDPAVGDPAVGDLTVGDHLAVSDLAGADQYVVPGCLFPLLRALLAEKDRPAEVQLARARMLERTVRLLQSCRAVTEPETPAARKKLAGLPKALRFPDTGAAAGWLRVRQPALLASARVAVADGELDTLARRLVAALVRALAAHRGTEAAAPELYGLHQLVLGVAERRGLFREQAAALLNLGDLDARTGRTHDALARYRAALDAGKAANDLYATGRAMESVGAAYQDLEDWLRAADWYGRALAQRQSRGEHADEARLYGRLGAVHTFARRYGDALRDWRAAVAGYRRLHDLSGQARALSEAGRVQEYAGRPQESLRTCQEAVELARKAGDARLEAALLLRLADTLDRLGDATAAGLHRGMAGRLLDAQSSAYEIRSHPVEG